MTLAMLARQKLPPPPVLSGYFGLNSNTAQVGQFYNEAPTISGGLAPISYSVVSGSLPAGISINPSTGVMSGTYTGAEGGNWDGAPSSFVTIRATDAANRTSDVNHTFFRYAAVAVGYSPSTVTSHSGTAGQRGVYFNPENAFFPRIQLVNNGAIGTNIGLYAGPVTNYGPIPISEIEWFATVTQGTAATGTYNSWQNMAVNSAFLTTFAGGTFAVAVELRRVGGGSAGALVFTFT